MLEEKKLKSWLSQGIVKFDFDFDREEDSTKEDILLLLGRNMEINTFLKNNKDFCITAEACGLFYNDYVLGHTYYEREGSTDQQFRSFDGQGGYYGSKEYNEVEEYRYLFIKPKNIWIDIDRSGIFVV